MCLTWQACPLLPHGWRRSIVVVSTPEGRRTPLPPGSHGQGRPTDVGDRTIPPGIARMLQQIGTPHARPQPPPKGGKTQLANLTCYSPTHRPLHEIHGSQYPVPAGSKPAGTILAMAGMVAGGDFKLALSTTHVARPLVVGVHVRGGSDQDPPDLSPTLLAPLFEDAMPDVAPQEDNTHREFDEDMDQYEVQYSAPPPVEMRPPQPSDVHPLHRAQWLCLELPSMARLGHGWIRESNA